MVLTDEPLARGGVRYLDLQHPLPISNVHGTQGPNRLANGKVPTITSSPDERSGVGVEPAAMTAPLRSEGQYGRIPKVSWCKSKKACADCGRGTHLCWNRYSGRFGDSYWLCQADAKQRGGVYGVAIQRFLNNEWKDDKEAEAPPAESKKAYEIRTRKHLNKKDKDPSPKLTVKNLRDPGYE